MCVTNLDLVFVAKGITATTAFFSCFECLSFVLSAVYSYEGESVSFSVIVEMQMLLYKKVHHG